MQITLKNLLMTSFTLGVVFILSLIAFVEGLIGREAYIQFINKYWVNDNRSLPFSFIALIGIFLIFRTLLRWTSSE